MIQNPEFAVVQLNEHGIEQAKYIGRIFDDLLEDLKRSCLVNSREFALAKTKLEEACFYAKKAMCNKPEHKKEGV